MLNLIPTTQDQDQRELERVAYHEAGHAVLAYNHSYEGVAVTIIPGESQTKDDSYKYNGKCTYICRSLLDDVGQYVFTQAVYYGGAIAECEHHPEWGIDFSWDTFYGGYGVGSDYDNSQKLIDWYQRLKQIDPTRVLDSDDIFNASVGYLLSHWDKVDVVAKAILKNKAVGHKHMTELLGEPEMAPELVKMQNFIDRQSMRIIERRPSITM